jgi:hypothetical protein
LSSLRPERSWKYLSHYHNQVEFKYIIHFFDVTLLFEQWIIYQNLPFILLFLNVWSLTFYCFRLNNVIYIYIYILGLSGIEPLLGILKPTLTFKFPSNHSATVTTLLYSIISIWWQSLLIQNSTICLKKQLINIYKAWYKYFRSGICSELTSTWTFKMYSSNTKTTNEPTASNNKSDRP